MSSYDWWGMLVEDARAKGPEALKLVLQVGETRFNTLLDGRASAAYSRILNGQPPKASTGQGLYESYEADMRRLLVLRPDRFDFPSERKGKPEG
jgi:hypothetical protein